jgi:hypothetical protein
MNTPFRKISIVQLRKEEAELLRQLMEVRRALSVVEGEAEKSIQIRVPSRAELLKQYLSQHSEGARIKDVPALLKSLGHVSSAALQTTNWVYQSKDLFVVKKGVVTLQPAQPIANGEAGCDLGPLGSENAASSSGVNKSSKTATTNDLRA